MGCLGSKEEKEPEPVASLEPPPPKQVDPRLPFENYRQLFNMKNSWKTITRAMDSTAKENLIRFFKDHPEHQKCHKNIAHMNEEQMRNSTAFENDANDLYNLFDEVMESVDGKLDMGISSCHRAGKIIYAKMDGFTPQYFKDMEESFIYAAKECLGDRFTEPTEKNFRNLYTFVTSQIVEGYNEAKGIKPTANGGPSVSGEEMENRI